MSAAKPIMMRWDESDGVRVAQPILRAERFNAELENCMATIREYFDTDFGYAARIRLKVEGINDATVVAILHCDFAGMLCYLSLFVPDAERPVDSFREIIERIEFGKTKLNLDGAITLPSGRAFPGELRIGNSPIFKMEARFFGDDIWIGYDSLTSTRRVFLYAERVLNEAERSTLREFAKARGIELQFRTPEHAARRSVFEKPLAFVSHDSRDKSVAKQLALDLQRLMCPVWYDEFSLKVGDHLRESIEKGLKECHKCVLLLSENFLANSGWTKVEFNSIFTREVLENKHLVLPVWCGVTKEQVFEYSPSLLNVKGLQWSEPHEEVARQLYHAIVGDDSSW